MRSIWLVVLVVLSSVTLAGCEAIGDIFQAGFAFGVATVVLILVLVGFLAFKIRR